MLKADLCRMTDNCRLYNGSDTVYYKHSNSLQAFFTAAIERNRAQIARQQ